MSFPPEGAFIIAALIFLALAFFASRARRGWIRWPGLVLAGLLVIFCAALALFIVKGKSVLSTPLDRPANELSVARTPEQIARGRQLAVVCAQCHSSTGRLPLDGGKDNMLGGPLGDLYAPNLTSAGPSTAWNDGQLLRALREGVDDHNLPLVIMPSEFFHVMSDSDAQALVAYIRSQPPATHALPPRRLGWMALALIGAGVFPTTAQAPISAPVTAPPAGPNAEYGKYLVNIYACGGCHSADLAGKKPGQGPAGPNLTQLVPAMRQEIFIRMFRTTQDGSKEMPFEEISAISTDDDLTAMYLYLHSLTPLPNP